MHNLDLIKRQRSTTENTFHLFVPLCPVLMSDFMSHVLHLFSISRWCYCEWDLEYCAGQVFDNDPLQCPSISFSLCLGSPSLLLSLHAQFVSSQYPGILSRFLCLALTCALLFFERKWLNMIEQHEWRKWCEAVDSVTRYILPCSFGKKIFAISKHEPWVSFREQILNIFCVGCVKDVKFAWRYFMIFHVRSVGIAQEDAADVEKLLFCNWCGDFSEYRHNARYHDKTMQCGHPGWKHRNVRAGFTSGLASAYSYVDTCYRKISKVLYSSAISSIQPPVEN